MRRLFAIGRDELRASTDEIIDVLGATLDASLPPIQQHINCLGLALCQFEVEMDSVVDRFDRLGVQLNRMEESLKSNHNDTMKAITNVQETMIANYNLTMEQMRILAEN